MLGEPTYGCNLINRIYQYNGVIIEDLCKDDIIEAATTWEPRCRILKDNITIMKDLRVVNIYIIYTDVVTGTSDELNLSFDVDGNY